jgi:6-phosphogluconolactonase
MTRAAQATHRYVFCDRTRMAREVALRFRLAAEAAIAKRGLFSCALTGGSAATTIYAALAEEKLDWSRVHVFWADERGVPATHADSNYGLCRKAFLDRVAVLPAHIHRMRGEEQDLSLAAEDYERGMTETLGTARSLDLVHLGMGPDGHVASLFPGHALLDERSRYVACLGDSPKSPARRLTLTLPALAAARAIWFLVAGAEKAACVREVLEEPGSTLPAARVGRAHARATWMLDRGAASLLKDAT